MPAETMNPDDLGVYAQLLGLDSHGDVPRSVRQVHMRVKRAFDRLVGGKLPPIGYVMVAEASGALVAAAEMRASKQAERAARRIAVPPPEADPPDDGGEEDEGEGDEETAAAPPLEEQGPPDAPEVAESDAPPVAGPAEQGKPADAVEAMGQWTAVSPGAQVIFKDSDGDFREGIFIRVLPYGTIQVQAGDGTTHEVDPRELRRKPGRPRGSRNRQ